ncbi:MAG: TIGR01777 family oxidoreductase [Pirellulaceae bacterium]|nr:TIGR01777 family oxidoreductase [Pirellulaceae bacterium]
MSSSPQTPLPRIAVTGSSGLIGSELLRRLRTMPANVVCLRRVESQAKSEAHCSPDIAWEPSRGVLRPEQLEGFDAIIHLAGRSVNSGWWTRAEKQRIVESRVTATQRLAEQLGNLQAKPRLFLGASAIGFYGDCGGRQVTEDTACAAQTFLGQLVRDWEAAAAPLTEHGIAVVHARFGVVLAPTDGALAKMLPAFRWAMGGRLGTGQQYLSWISLQDSCRALMHLLQLPDACGPYNVVSPNPVTNRQFTAHLAKALHRPAIMSVPGWVLRCALGEMADELLLASCRAVPQRLLETGFTFQHTELPKMLREHLAG